MDKAHIRLSNTGELPATLHRTTKRFSLRKTIAAGLLTSGALSVIATVPAGAATLGTWSAAGSGVTGRTNATATLLSNGNVLVAGGITGTGPGAPTADAELYNPTTNAWSLAGALTTARSGAIAQILSNGNV